MLRHRLPLLIVLAIVLAAYSVARAGEPTSPAPTAFAPLIVEPAAPKTFPRADALVSVTTLLDLFKQKELKLVLIDARNRDLYDQGHLPGARNIPSDPLQAPDAPP